METASSNARISTTITGPETKRATVVPDWKPLGLAGVLGSPAIAVSSSGTKLGAAVTADGHLMGKVLAASQIWKQLDTPGSGAPAGVVATPVVVASPTQPGIDIFCVGIDGSAYHVAWSGTTAATWTRINGQAVTSVTAVVNPFNDSVRYGLIDLFARGLANTMLHSKQFADGSFGAWVSVPGPIYSAPSAVAWKPSEMAVVSLDEDNRVQLLLYDYGKGPGVWVPLAGSMSAPPVIVSMNDKRLDIFARGPGLELEQQYYDGAWSGWVSHWPTRLACAPQVTAPFSKHIEVLFLGLSDNEIYRTFFAGGSWGTPTRIPGPPGQGRAVAPPVAHTYPALPDNPTIYASFAFALFETVVP